MRRLVHVAFLILWVVGTGRLGAQGGGAERTRIVVRDSAGIRIPYAFVQLNGGVSKVADDSGRVTFNEAPRDSIKLLARRMGYTAFSGWARRLAGEDVYFATLTAAPTLVAPLRVEERKNTMLARTGFYDRLDRAQNAATLSRFITPEELDLRNPVKISQMFQGEQTIRVTFFTQRALLEGRGGRCGMTVMLDGQVQRGMMEELINIDQNPPLRRDLERVWGDPQAEHAVRVRHSGTLTSVDELIQAGSVAAIEIYPSPSAIPVELARLMGGSSCGLIAIWSGTRR